MSLEQNVKELNESIKALIVSMTAFASQPVTNLALQVVEEIAAEQVKPVTKAKAKQPEELTIAELKTPVNNPDELRAELQALSSSMIANKRASKEKIKGVIATYGNATILKNVPDADLPELKAKILALGE
tara:strand:- start:6 stop:395 length:390 start_codon:yes stop_codon:yes gene_type:complete